MPHFTVRAFNDMGHLMLNPYSSLPDHIRSFVMAKCEQNVKQFTHKTNHAYFYGLEEGLQKRWTYRLGGDSIEVVWDLPMATQLRRDTTLSELANKGAATSYSTSTPFTMTPVDSNSDYGIPSGGMSAF